MIPANTYHCAIYAHSHVDAHTQMIGEGRPLFHIHVHTVNTQIENGYKGMDGEAYLMYACTYTHTGYTHTHTKWT